LSISWRERRTGNPSGKKQRGVGERRVLRGEFRYGGHAHGKGLKRIDAIAGAAEIAHRSIAIWERIFSSITFLAAHPETIANSMPGSRASAPAPFE